MFAPVLCDLDHIRPPAYLTGILGQYDCYHVCRLVGVKSFRFIFVGGLFTHVCPVPCPCLDPNECVFVRCRTACVVQDELSYSLVHYLFLQKIILILIL